MTSRRHVERSDDGRWLVLDGRRWWAADPGSRTTSGRSCSTTWEAARSGVPVAVRAGDVDAEH